MTTTGSSPAPEPLLDLHRLAAGIRWRRRTWVSMAVLGLLAGALFAILVPPQPTAVTRVLVLHENDEPTDVGALIQTDLAILQTTRIAEAAMERVGADEPPAEFLETYQGVGLTANVLELTVRGSSDRDAIARAQALADTFIADHIERTEATADAEAQAFLDRRADAETQLAEVDRDIAAATDGLVNTSAAELDTLFARRAELAAQAQSLGEQADETGSEVPRVVAGTQIVDAPRIVPGSLLVTGGMNALIGLVLGLAAGLTMAAVASVVQDRPVLRREISTHLGASVIAQIPAPRRGPARLWRRSRPVAERKLAAATLARLVRDDSAGVSLLDLGAAPTAAALTMEIAGELAIDRPVVVIDDLPGRQVHRIGETGEGPVRIVDGAEYPADQPPPVPGDCHLGVGSVEPGTPWTDLRRLGAQTILVVRAGYASTLWLHTVARQLADADIPVIGVVLVHPDPRDRTDGTLWDGLHTALRGRVSRRTVAGPRIAPGQAHLDDLPTQEIPAVRATQQNMEVSP